MTGEERTLTRTGLKGRRVSAQGQFAPANAALGSGRHNVTRPERVRVGRRFCLDSLRPFRANSLACVITQDGAALALGWYTLPRWGKGAVQTDAERQTLHNAATATKQQIALGGGPRSILRVGALVLLCSRGDDLRRRPSPSEPGVRAVRARAPGPVPLRGRVCGRPAAPGHRAG